MSDHAVADDGSPRSSAAIAELAVAAVSGAVFAVGLALSGMTRPTKVLAFLDVASGAWDPSLALVMAGAVTVYAIVWRLVRGRAAPLLATKWSLPTHKDIDGRLVAGAAIFGIGWGLGGFCPGPALVSLVSGGAGVVTFALAMVLAMAITSRLTERGNATER